MCNVAGYVGDGPAAGVLLEMLERQEAFAGGYYTGIATVADEQLHSAKVIGDVAALRSETDAENLPGRVGIIHSRSKSGGDREWSHPFIDCAGRMAYIANGHGGFFENVRDKHAVAAQLAEQGHVFRSHSDEPIGKYPVLPDGTCVHTSEVMCHLIESLIAEGAGAADAMRLAYQEFPGEIAGLMVHLNAADHVIASRINQPLMIGRGREGTYVATTAMAFPSAAIEWLAPMPANATAAIGRSSITVLPFDPAPGKVAEPIPWKAGHDAALDALADGQPKGLGALTKATAALWPDDAAPQKDMMVYEILRGLYREGRVRFEDVPVPGVIEGTHAPHKQAILLA